MNTERIPIGTRVEIIDTTRCKGQQGTITDELLSYPYGPVNTGDYYYIKLDVPFKSLLTGTSTVIGRTIRAFKIIT